MEVKHCCVDCGQVMAVHEHSSYQEIKNCLTGMRPMCDLCQRWLGSLLAQERERWQEGVNGIIR
jgi:hypothetical protein